MSLSTQTLDFAELCTLGCGPGPTEVVDVSGVDALQAALSVLPRRSLILGGGSNIVPPLRSLSAPVLRLVDGGEAIVVSEDGRVEVFAGVCWDRLVATSVIQGWSGIECLSGIPGSCGAAPIQNIGAYGQSLADTLVWVDLVERGDPSTVKRVAASDLGLGYRHSVLKAEEPGARIVLAVGLRLKPAEQALRPAYRGLEARLPGSPTPHQIREAVLAERRSKGMVLDESDPDTRSVGSFFINPVLTSAEWNALRERLGPLAAACPAHSVAEGTKLSAAWLIEQAGFAKGHRFDDIQGVALSTKHCLAITNRGTATPEGIRIFAARLQEGVEQRWKVSLQAEPRFVGDEA